MSHPNPRRSLSLGIHEGELQGKEYAAFWNPKMSPLSKAAQEALVVGAVAAPLLLPLTAACQLLTSTEHELENGYGMHEDGSVHIAISTEMPNVTPAMIDWWFGWHSEEPQRYKLWHPRAHVHAQWSTPESPTLALQKGRGRYISRTSLVDEYIGSALQQVAIHFLTPSQLGLDEQALSDAQEATVVCARISFASHPVDIGYLAHHVHRVAGGAQMRSRFWLGGQHAAVRTGSFADPLLSQVARHARKVTAEAARELLVHCAQEMAHLATFLPKLHTQLHNLP